MGFDPKSEDKQRRNQGHLSQCLEKEYNADVSDGNEWGLVLQGAAFAKALTPGLSEICICIRLK